ncbi:hypothetical protein CRE_27873 [Caenorhabditis remanei]|uniref:Uncharacterized protein n=1 Tax=Caenorhabditis remanei TaxID=31234 RepID=E3NG86_CAERE|nr:hypothetical protein CRE_27873 [Caenorhabditis remanei]
MRLLLLFSFFILLLSAFSTIPTYDSGILEILIESGAPVHAGFVVTYENKSHLTWRHLKPNTPELLIFEGFDLSKAHEEFMNVTIHDNVTSNSVTFKPVNKPVYDIDELPLPYTGLQIKMKCAEDWYGFICQTHCLVKDEFRCDGCGRPACAQGYCGWNCLKSGSECPVFANCSCQNGGECYSPLSESSTRCHCPTGYLGDDCQFFYIFKEKLDFVTNFGAKLTVPNKFSNRADIYQLFEEYGEEPRTSGNRICDLM